MNQSSSRIMKLAFVSVLSAIGFIMMYLDFPLPMFPSFLKMDFGDIPSLVAGLTFGPLMGILVQFLKNVLHFIFSGSETGIPIGQMANFFAGSILVVCTALAAKKMSGMRGLLVGLGVGVLTMATMLSLANYFVIFPAYAFLLNWTVDGPEKMAIVLYGIAPFNVVKGLIIALVFVPLYLRLKPIIERQFLRA